MKRWRRSTPAQCLLACLTAGALLLSACQTGQQPSSDVAAVAQTPIIFVHGNGDNAGLWITTAWRFESNGWRKDRLFAFDLPHPTSRDLDDVEQPNRTSAEEYTRFLADRVAEVRQLTGASQVILIANSRGGYPIRRFVRDDRQSQVFAAILGGTPNHGTYVSPTIKLTSEYNGAGPWLTGLNAAQGPSGLEVTPGVPFLTLRSDHNDKYAQPTGVWFGLPQLSTNVAPDGPALAGATNLVLPGADHRETAYSKAAFDAMFAFLTGAKPSVDVIALPHPAISGRIFASQEALATNTALPGAHLMVFAVDRTTGARVGAPVLDQVVGVDGKYGPMVLDANQRYEFLIDHPNYALTHIYPGAFKRSSDWFNLTPQTPTVPAVADSNVQLVRPDGYFNAQRDQISLDGATPKAIVTSVPAISAATITVPPAEAMRAVIARFNDEQLVAPAWPGLTGDGRTQRVVFQLLD